MIHPLPLPLPPREGRLLNWLRIFAELYQIGKTHA